MKNSLTIAALLLLTACAGRNAAPISLTQAGDNNLSCEQITAEQQNNANKIQALVKENDNAHSSNIAIGVIGGLLFWPALFALDTGDAQKVEIKALKDRTDYLNGIALQKHCNEPTAPIVQAPQSPSAPVVQGSVFPTDQADQGLGGIP